MFALVSFTDSHYDRLIMAICKSCGQSYSRWFTPVSARGVCRGCFQPQLVDEPDIEPELFGLTPALPVATPVEFLPSAALASPSKQRNRIRLTSFMPRTRSKFVFVLVMAAYEITFGALLATSRRTAQLPKPPPSFFEGSTQHPIEHIFEVLLFAPIIESLMLIGIFELVRVARAPAAVQVLTAALFVSELHAWPWWPHAIIVFPSFCIDAGAYLYWRSRGSKKAAFLVVASIHALANLIPAIGTLGYVLRKA